MGIAILLSEFHPASGAKTVGVLHMAVLGTYVRHSLNVDNLSRQLKESLPVFLKVDNWPFISLGQCKCFIGPQEYK